MRPDMRGVLLMAGTWVLLLATLPGVAQSPADSPAVHRAIARLPQALRAPLYRRDAELRAMTPAQRTAFEQRIAQWKALPESVRRNHRERWQAWQALPADERARLQAAARDFAALPVQAQLDVRAEYARLDEADRRGWLLGPALGADWSRLQPLLLQVPAEQREPLLAALRAMTAQQRVDLGVLAQRTPPQGRDRLRRDLLAQPAAQRGAWLVAMLDR